MRLVQSSLLKVLPWEHSLLHSHELTLLPTSQKKKPLKEDSIRSCHTCYAPPTTLPSSSLLPSGIILFPGFHLFQPLERPDSSVLKCINKFMLPAAKYKDLPILFHSIPQRIWNVSVLVPSETPSLFCVLKRLEEPVEHQVNVRSTQCIVFHRRQVIYWPFVLVFPLPLSSPTFRRLGILFCCLGEEMTQQNVDNKGGSKSQASGQTQWTKQNIKKPSYPFRIKILGCEERVRRRGGGGGAQRSS